MLTAGCTAGTSSNKHTNDAYLRVHVAIAICVLILRIYCFVLVHIWLLYCGFCCIMLRCILLGLCGRGMLDPITTRLSLFLMLQHSAVQPNTLTCVKGNFEWYISRDQDYSPSVSASWHGSLPSSFPTLLGLPQSAAAPKSIQSVPGNIQHAICWARRPSIASV